MSIYTKTGDQGKTGLLRGERVYKSDQRIEAYGTVDEVVSALALARSFITRKGTSDILSKIEKDLFILSTELASSEPQMLKDRISQEDIEELEEKIDEIMTKTSLNNGFILPGPYNSSASIHLARTIARRAEREVVKLRQTTPLRNEILVYLNRLSDLLFALAKYEEEEETIMTAMEKIKSTIKADIYKTIDLKTAELIANAAKDKAKEIGIPMVISVVDSGGNLVVLYRMDDALLASIEISVNKAYTSVAFKRPTSELNIPARPGGELFGINTLRNGGYVVFGGGLPILNGEKVIGGIGVSGGTVEQDTAVAEAGIKIITEGS